MPIFWQYVTSYIFTKRFPSIIFIFGQKSCFLGHRQLVNTKSKYSLPGISQPQNTIHSHFFGGNLKEMEFFLGLIWGRIQNWETAPFHIILFGLDEFIYFCFFFLYHFFASHIFFFSYKNNFSKQEALEHTLNRFDKNNSHMKKSRKQSETSHYISDLIQIYFL